MFKRSNQRRNRNSQKSKKNNNKNIFKLHRHTVKCSRKSFLKDILLEDDLEKFKEFYEDNFDNIKEEFYFNCNNERKCKKFMPVQGILEHNHGEILKYIIKKEKCNVYDLVRMIDKMKSSDIKYSIFKKIFMDSILYTDLNNDEINAIFDKLFFLNDWDLIDLFHLMGYRVININKVISLVPPNKIKGIIKLGYKFNDECLLKIFLENYHDDDLLKMLGITNEIVCNKKHYNLISNIYKDCSLDFIKKIENMGYKPSQLCLDNAISGFNFLVIYYLISKGFSITDNNLCHLFLLDIQKKKKNKKRGRLLIIKRRRRYTDRSSFLNIIKKINNYEDNIIKLIKFYNEKNNNIKILENIISKAIRGLCLGNCFNLIIYLDNNFNINTNLSKKDLDICVALLIENDELDKLKDLFNTKIILPIDISNRPEYLTTALTYNSSKIINYLANELKMICSDRIKLLLKYNNNLVKKTFIQNLEIIGYPIDKEIMRILCENGNTNIIKYLLEKNYKIPSFCVEKALALKNYELVELLIKNGCVVKTKNLIDRVLSNERRIIWGFYRSRDIKKITIQQINYIIKLGGTATKKSSNMLAEKGCYPELIHLYKKFGISPDKESLLKYLTFDHYHDSMGKIIIKALEYINEVICVNFIDNLEYSQKNQIIKVLARSWNNNKHIFKYFIEKTNFKLELDHMYDFINNGDNLDAIHYLESFNIIPTKDIMIKALKNRCKKIITYLNEKYKFDITLKDIHNIIVVHWINRNLIDIAVDELHIKLTPYTVKLITDRNLTRWGSYLIEYVLDIVEQLTQETYDKIMNFGLNKLINKIIKKKYDIVIYEPTDEEKPDENYLVNNNFDDYDDNDSIHERDNYLTNIMNEGNIINNTVEFDNDGDDEDDEIISDNENDNENINDLQ